jgi:hypothetical protein
MKKRVSITRYVDTIIEIDDDKIESLLAGYRESICSEATVDDLFEQIAYTEAILQDDFVEGIGERYEDFNYSEDSTDTEYELIDCSNNEEEE